MIEMIQHKASQNACIELHSIFCDFFFFFLAEKKNKKQKQNKSGNCVRGHFVGSTPM